MEQQSLWNVFEIKDGSHYSISVYGADKAGIVHAITKEITKNNLNIIDLQTKITGGSTKVYIMMLEVVANNEDNENYFLLFIFFIICDYKYHRKNAL